VPATSTGRFLITVVTPSAPNALARVTSTTKDATNGSQIIEIEIRHSSTSALMDSEFYFMTIDRSGV
jgi:hypothetical protein